MNNYKKIKNGILLIFLVSISFCSGQISYNTTYEEQALIHGTWVAEGSSVSDKWVFNGNLLYEFSNNIIDERYTWSIISTTNSGVKSIYLEIVNINDSTDKYNYEISIINDEILTLIYQRDGNHGISKPMTYIKQ